MGNHVVYIHYEEGDPGSTIERLRPLSVAAFADPRTVPVRRPVKPIRLGWIDSLLAPTPTLVLHDGVNEAMSLHGADIMAADGASACRRARIIPCTGAGAATLACDHLLKDREGRGRDAYGSVHKGNALDGAHVMLENAAPFGRGMRGFSYAFVTKDRPGHLRKRGQPTDTAGKTFMGTLVVDDETYGLDFAMLFFAPNDDDDDGPIGHTPNAGLADDVCTMIDALPGNTVTSMRMLLAEMPSAPAQLRRLFSSLTRFGAAIAQRLTCIPGNSPTGPGFWTCLFSGVSARDRRRPSQGRRRPSQGHRRPSQGRRRPSQARRCHLKVQGRCLGTLH